MHTTTTTAPAMAHTKHGRARALCAAGGALAAALAWIVEVPLLGIHLTYRFGGGHIQTIAAAGSSASLWLPRCSDGCFSPCWSGAPRTPGLSGPPSRW